MRIERCRECGAVHEHPSGDGALTLFTHRYMAKCTACGVEKDRDDIGEDFTLCDVCREPLKEGVDYDWDNPIMTAQLSLTGGAMPSTLRAQIHPRCMPGLGATLEQRFNAYVEDEVKPRSTHPASWWDRLLGRG